jgi:hypothetical protein
MDKIVMTKDRLPQIPTIRITTASRILAQLRARKAVKAELQKQGLKADRRSASNRREFEPPHGRIKIRLFRQQYQRIFEKTAEIRP